MGAGKGHPGEPGMLEASPGAIALVVLFFLVTTLSFEHGLRALRKYLQRRNRKGLLKATNNLANEIMLLGVAGLLLMACTPELTAVCTPTEHIFTPWLNNVKPCACCLSRTEGVSPCFLKERQCPADLAATCKALDRYTSVVVPPDPAVCAAEAPEASENLSSAGDGSEGAGAAGSAVPGSAEGVAAGVVSPDSEAANAGHAAAPSGRRLRASPPDALASEAQGPTCAECKEETFAQCDHRSGYAPAVTSATLEQVHMLLFFAAITHIVCSMLALLLGNLKLRWWARLSGKAAEDDLAAKALAVAAGASQAGSAAPGSPGAGGQQVHVKVSPAEGAPAQDDSAAAADVRISQETWKGRPETVQGFGGWAREVGVMTWRILLAPHFLTVTTQEYSLIRACFYYHHGHLIMAAQQAPPSEQHLAGDASHEDHSSPDLHKRAGDTSQRQQLPQVAPKGHAAARSWLEARNWRGVFAMYLTECLERDSAKAVGLGLPMWVCLVAFVLVSGGIGWATWVFSVLAGGLLLALNIVLMSRLRQLTAGGRVHEHKLWSIRQRWILELIKLLLFFLSFVVGQSIFFAIFFGPDSCFFSNTGFQSHMPLPWYLVMLLDVVMMLCLALFTLPLYSLILHTTQVDAKLLHQRARQALLHQQPATAGEVELPAIQGV